MHSISQPIEMDSNKFTAYSFGEGIRTFLVSKVLDMVEIEGIVGKVAFADASPEAQAQ